MALFLISVFENRWMHAEQIDKSEFLDNLNNGDYEDGHFRTELPSGPSDYWEVGYVLIEGEIVMPEHKSRTQ